MQVKAFFYLLLRIVCYPALAVVLAAGLALIFVSLNGECPPIIGEIGVTCVTKFSQTLADFGLLVGTFALDKGFPIVLAVGGLIFLMRDTRRKRT
jgi:hypothetical protein